MLGYSKYGVSRGLREISSRVTFRPYMRRWLTTVHSWTVTRTVEKYTAAGARTVNIGDESNAPVSRVARRVGMWILCPTITTVVF